MAFEPSVAVFDACILYPFHLRNILIQLAVDRLSKRDGRIKSTMSGSETWRRVGPPSRLNASKTRGS